MKLPTTYDKKYWNMIEETDQNNDLIANVGNDIIGKNLDYIIGIDGRYDCGKTTLANYLAWKFSIPVIHTDSYIIANEMREYNLDLEGLKKDVTKRDGKLKIIEGVFLQQTIESLNLNLNYSIYVSKIGDEDPYDERGDENSSQWLSKLKDYEEKYNCVTRASFNFVTPVKLH